ncbi:MAG: hypothetical protein EA422_14015 [Gemmatimonadales bacterium]|nr:MAG: hypothetical protein EA422_14015 [Gemmatimonadales bacterium]
MPSPLRTALLVLAIMLLPGTTHAQQAVSAGLGTEREVGGVFSLRGTALEVAGHVVPMAGLGFGIRISPAMELAGEGSFALRAVPISPRAPSDRSELTLGYGGVVVRYGGRGDGGHSGVHAHLLAGAGTSRLRSPLVDAELNADNFYLLEAGMDYRFSLGAVPALAVGGGYRFSSATTELPTVRSGPMKGPFVSLSLLMLRAP